MGIGFGGERLGLVAIRFPRLAAFCLFAALVCVGASLPRLSFDDDIHRVFLSDSGVSQAQRAYDSAQDPPLSTALIHIVSLDAFDAMQMTALRDLSLDLERVEGVTAVASPFVLRWPPTINAPSGRPVFGPQIDPSFVDDLSAFEDLETGLPLFVNTARTAMLFSVSINTDATTVEAASHAVRQILDGALPADLSASLTGEDVISTEIVSALKGDLIGLNLIGAVIITLAAIALVRDVRLTVLAVVPALVGAVGVLGLSVWLGYPITVLNNVIPILLLVLGVADGVHLALNLKATGSVRAAIKNVGPACALTALTTAAAFASILVTRNAQLFEFAVLGSLGAILSFCFVIVTFALLGQKVLPTDKPIPKFSAMFAQTLSAKGVMWPRLTLATCVLVLVGATWGFSQTKAWFPLYQNLPADSKTRATNDTISEDFGGAFQMVVETDGGWAQTQTLVAELEAIVAKGAVLSEVNLARWLGQPDVQPTPQDLAALPEVLADQLRPRGDLSRIFLSVPEPMRSQETLAQFDKIYDVARAAGADTIIGLPTLMRLESITLIEQLVFSLIVASLGATALVAFAFRSIHMVPILIIPNTLPLVITGASLHVWADGQLTPTAVLALTIAFGIAIDDTVHFLNRYVQGVAKGESAAQAVTTASSSAGMVMVVTTLLLSAGLSVTLFSDFVPIRVFGGMMIVTLWAAVLIDLLLLPAVLTRKRDPQPTTSRS
ncbi:MMPL family protein [Pseudooctadecabacter jejudonensis]|uniref:MMPL family protein n=1 Tax=Pseudooctadecabacter jejudonensis TaxID=1391910 RepID=A0A1Y5TII1_9RHOB|nr:MMPL family protein [Pseudooctadecabacter jejudonensis]